MSAEPALVIAILQQGEGLVEKICSRRSSSVGASEALHAARRYVASELCETSVKMFLENEGKSNA